MLKTYRIIPLVFILCLFGFTLITVAPVFAQTDHANEGMSELRTPQERCAGAPTDEERANCLAANKRMLNLDVPREAMDMSPLAIEERCAGAPTDEERANCIAANKRMKSHDGPRDGMRGEHHDGPRDGSPGIPPTADMSTPEERCAGAPTDEDRENCIAANKGMGDDRRDGPGQASDATVVGSTEERCADSPNAEELANCITLDNRANSAGIIQAIEKLCADRPNDEEMANCIGDK
ncbi:hypothetical protein M1N16_08110, partial [Nitrospinaceae bacterium]|nr:hypothetical protein [Nitrospinaceae bacterium]